MNEERDAELTRELDVLVAAKDREQRRMRLFFLAALACFIVMVLSRHHLFVTFPMAALCITAIVLGVRHHLRASALRGQALEKILAEAFRRAGQDAPKADA